MSNWRAQKFYCLNTINNINRDYNDEQFDEMKNSFNKKANKLINNKKLRWAKKYEFMEALKTQTVRRLNRLINQNNINYDLYDVETFN